MVLSSFVLSFTTPDLSLFPLKDLTDRDRSTGMACRGLVESVSQWGEGRHIPGHLVSGVRVGTYRDISERPSLPSPFKSNIRSCWGQKEALGLFVLTFSPVGPHPPCPFYWRGKKMGGACLCLL